MVVVFVRSHANEGAIEMRELTVQELDCVSGGNVYSGEGGLQVYTTYNNGVLTQTYSVPTGTNTSINFGFSFNTASSSITQYNLGLNYGSSSYNASYSPNGTLSGSYGYNFGNGSISVYGSTGSGGSSIGFSGSIKF